jgi:hypothetical protein
MKAGKARLDMSCKKKKTQPLLHPIPRAMSHPIVAHLIDYSLLYNKVFIPAMRGFLLQGKLLKKATEQLATAYQRDDGQLELPQLIPMDDVQEWIDTKKNDTSTVV